jgi:hypothetical protein
MGKQRKGKRGPGEWIHAGTDQKIFIDVDRNTGYRVSGSYGRRPVNLSA